MCKNAPPTALNTRPNLAQVLNRQVPGVKIADVCVYQIFMPWYHICRQVRWQSSYPIGRKLLLILLKIHRIKFAGKQQHFFVSDNRSE